VWLASLGRDGSAALAAGELYGSLPPAERDAWLDAVSGDLGHELGASLAAAYAPLLAHEEDPGRRARILRGIANAGLGAQVGRMKAALGPGRVGFEREPCTIVVLLRGLAFDLSEGLVCALTNDADGDEHMREVTYLGLTSKVEAERVAVEMGAPCTLLDADPCDATDRLAHVIWNDSRKGRRPHADLTAAAHFFGPEAAPPWPETGEDA
jgi:hypothetical protein